MQVAFRNALAAGHEGIVAKVADSPYAPGRRGGFWFKLKEPFATLDVVVTAVEYGHGKRHKVLSDYTFAVRDGDTLLNIGKAYSGLTDVEISEYTDFFLRHTIEDHGHVRTVEPLVVLEVGFNNIQKSSRHNSGYALRFPRIVRIRTDKVPSDIDTLETVSQIIRQPNLPTPNHPWVPRSERLPRRVGLWSPAFVGTLLSITTLTFLINASEYFLLSPHLL